MLQNVELYIMGSKIVKIMQHPGNFGGHGIMEVMQNRINEAKSWNHALSWGDKQKITLFDFKTSPKSWLEIFEQKVTFQNKVKL